MKNTTPHQFSPESKIQAARQTMKANHIVAACGKLRSLLAGTMLLILMCPTESRANEVNVSWNWISGGPWSEDPILGTKNKYWFPEVTSTAGYHVLIGGPTTNYAVSPGSDPEVVISGWSESCKKLTLGFAQGYRGTLSVLSQNLAVDEEVVVGGTGRGTLFVSGPTAPGRVVSHGECTIGESATGVGVANIGGIWTIADTPTDHGTLEVGNFGNGTLNVLTGGSVTTRFAYVGRSTDGVGFASVSGPGAKLTTTSIVYPSGGTGGISLLVGFGGTGTLNILNGGKVESYDCSIGRFTNGSGEALISGAGSEWMSGSLQIGDYGSGEITIRNGGKVTSIIGYLGTYSSGNGVATVKDPGSEWVMTGDPYTSADMRIGNSGQGALNIVDGGKVTSNYARVGGQGTSDGSVIVSGAGSEWVVSGVVYPDGSNGGVALYVGSDGDGNVVVQNQGKISSFASDIGSSGNGTGTVTVTGIGSEWNSSGISVGRYSTGNLNVLAGGKVASTNGYLGDRAYSGGLPLMGTGVATVDGAGSTWSTTNPMYVGNGGTGTLNVRNGGKIAASKIYLSNGESTSVGTVNVTGVPGMRGIIETALLSGNSSENSSLTFDGGVFRGSGDFQVSGFQSGKVRVESGGVHIDTQAFHGEIFQSIHGVGGLTKSGTGSLSLYGGNTYTGVTEVMEGSLFVESGLHGSLYVHPVGTFAGGGLIHGDATIHGTLDIGQETLRVKSCTWSGSTDGSATMRVLLGDLSAGQLVVDQALVKEGNHTYCFDFDFSGVHSGIKKSYVLMKFGSSTFDVSDFSYINLAPGLAGKFEFRGGELRFHVTAIPAPHLGAALDNSLTWTSGGASPWGDQNATTHDGMDAARSGAIGDSQDSWMEATVSGPGSLTFWWKVSSEQGYDFLEFYIDGLLQGGRISGNVDWETKSYSISSGTHTFRWRYMKEEIWSSGSDAAWVDQVNWVPTSGYAGAASAAGLSGGNAQPNAIPFDDGVPNLIKYAFNLNLAGPDRRTMLPGGSAGLPHLSRVSGASPVFRIEYLRRLNAGLNYLPQTCTSLESGDWEPVTGTPQTITIDTSWERVIHEIPATAERMFGRVGVELGP